MRRLALCILLGTLAFGCGDPGDAVAPDAGLVATWDAHAIDSTTPDVPFDAPLVEATGPLGARFEGDLLVVRVFSSAATRIEAHFFGAATGEDERLRIVLEKKGDVFVGSVTRAELATSGVKSPVLYGLRAWGPNWPWTASWTKGSSEGFVADVDGSGNRFDPNKLLIDPYARAITHDPITPMQLDGSYYGAGSNRSKDSGKVAPKGIVLEEDLGPKMPKPSRAFKDEIIYEVHVRGFTKNDPDVPAELRGTFEGAAKKASYLRSLGVTAIELLPVQETQNDQNDVAEGTAGDNYWGYATLAFFAPDRRYSADRSPFGPTKSLRAMVRAFHAEGIKVYLDVVYNHTGEGGLLSFRGLDAPAYYQLSNDKKGYQDNTGTGANTNCAHPAMRNLILDSLAWLTEVVEVDGFRFDLASVLGNGCKTGCFSYDKNDPGNALQRAQKELPTVDLIAEPWAIGPGTYQIGNFPSRWAEWNGIYRDTIRRDQNRYGVEMVTPAQLVARLSGSPDLFADDGRKPWHSVNFVVAHDGFTLRDLYAYDGKQNAQPWPYGPSNGGTDDNLSWSHGGDPVRQRQAARTGLALLMLSAGVPMIVGGDEMYRTQYGNNNPYNLDSEKNWLQWSDRSSNARFFEFAQRLFAFRNVHAELRPAEWWTSKEVTFLGDDGKEADAAYLADANHHFLAMLLHGPKPIWIGYDGWTGAILATLPKGTWAKAIDTSALFESESNAWEPGKEPLVSGPTIKIEPRSVVVLVAR